MATAFAILLVLHASIHLLGAAKAFGWADLSKLTQSISQAQGVLWLASALLFTVTATALFVWPRGWWLIGAGAIAVSMLAIIPSWADAKAGAGVNGIVALGLVLGCLSQGPSSLRAEYEADVAAVCVGRDAGEPRDRGGPRPSSAPGAEISPRRGRRRTTASVEFSCPDARSHP